MRAGLFASPGRRGVAAGVLVLVVLCVGVLWATTRDPDDERRADGAPTTTTIGGPARAPAEPAVESTEVGPAPVTVPPEAAWRLGYGGWGPIELGMSMEAASTASGLQVVESYACGGDSLARVAGDPMDDLSGMAGLRSFGVSNGRIVSIWTSWPEAATISGVRRGSTEAEVRQTYGNVESRADPYDNRVLTITNPEGRVVVFGIDSSAGTVASIAVALSWDHAWVPVCQSESASDAQNASVR